MTRGACLLTAKQKCFASAAWGSNATAGAKPLELDDLRILVALAREKTLAAASRRLGIDHTTVTRRLRTLEDSLGAVLFERAEGRWLLTEFGQRAVERAECMEEAVAGTIRRFWVSHGGDRSPRSQLCHSR